MTTPFTPPVGDRIAGPSVPWGVSEVRCRGHRPGAVLRHDLPGEVGRDAEGRAASFESDAEGRAASFARGLVAVLHSSVGHRLALVCAAGV